MSATTDADYVALVVHGAPLPAGVAPFFFANDREALEPAAEQVVVREGGGFRLTLTPRTSAPATLAGVLRIGDASHVIDVPVGAPATRSAALPLLLAFAGGLLLNLMPCVFPVLALKALSLAGLAGEARPRVRRHGLVYAAGIVASFWLLAGVLLAARAGGAELGWGFQLQEPIVVGLFALLMFAVGLNLSGVFELPGFGGGDALARKGGATGAFFTGVLAVAVAAPCTAPFMGTAIGYALGQPAAVALAVFTSLGLGLAFPYVLVTFVPASRPVCRVPGVDGDVEAAPRLSLLATVVWLVWVASFQAGPQAVGAILMGLVLIAFAAWRRALRGEPRSGRGNGRRRRGAPRVHHHADRHADNAFPADGTASTTFAWEPFSTARIAELRAAGRPVFVDFTAAWCVPARSTRRSRSRPPRSSTK